MRTEKDSHATSSLNDCRLITLNKHHHENGNLTVVEGEKELPFDIKRIYYIYDVPGGAERGGHSHKECASFLVAVSGSFNVEITDGVNKQVFTPQQIQYRIVHSTRYMAYTEQFLVGFGCAVHRITQL